ncbi:RNA-binding domain-containing protein [Gonapodya prolifera JEL478]|uniref:RNA-binding domain-containing protein n=1 Tax=Gonapodya prolifera (strain JEL478) TaxID=1344416 RepID=A0A139AMW2_GONPJ|nr:RNA-binding domain-containing protein [Gonapodya prolifera JEL478]|eukprot:KXS17795.1 RNA-binding domain-containing protein [Gonapodya prolifera JEL478]
MDADRDRDRDRDDVRDRRDDRRDRGEENPGNNLFVRGLSHKTKDEDVRNLFDQFGKIKKCEIMYDPHTKESRGFAFVSYEHVEDAEACFKAFTQGPELHGKILTIEKARRGRARTPTPGRYYGPPKSMGPPPPRGARYGGYEDRYDRYRPYDGDRDRDRGYYDSRRDYYDSRRDYDRDRRDDRRR